MAFSDNEYLDLAMNGQFADTNCMLSTFKGALISKKDEVKESRLNDDRIKEINRRLKDKMRRMIEVMAKLRPRPGAPCRKLNPYRLCRSFPPPMAVIHEDMEGERVCEANFLIRMDPDDDDFSGGPCRLQKYRSLGRSYPKTISDQERRQIESLYQGLKTSVKVSSSAATLVDCSNFFLWTELYYGVPVVVEIYPDSDKPVAMLYIAERGTGLPMWSRVIDCKSVYTRDSTKYHVLSPTDNPLGRVGLRFQNAFGATSFFAHMSRLMSKMQNLRRSSSQSLRRQRPPPAAQPLSKAEISSPCNFQHITSVGLDDFESFISLQVCLHKEEEDED